MFSLIITIISIALVGLLAVAAVFYGGDAFTEGNQKAEAAKRIGAGQQIVSAIHMYQADNASLPSTLSELSSNKRYLTAVPDGDWVVSKDAVVSAVSEQQCMDINHQLNISATSIPSCSDPQFAATTVCCAN